MKHCTYHLRRRRRGERGFTLIELLVVIAVLAILAAIVIFNVTGVVNRGQTQACNTDIKTVQSAVDAYISDNGGSSGLSAGAMSAAEMNLLVPKYIHTTPTSCASFTLTSDGAGGFTVS